MLRKRGGPLRLTAPRLVGYTPQWRDSTVSLWNRVFQNLPNFVPMSPSLWRRRIEEFSLAEGQGNLSGAGPSQFDPRHFRLAILDDEVVGFAHGSLWEDEFLARLLPDDEPARVGTLLIIAVDPAHRGRGLGSDLLRNLEETLEKTHQVNPPLRVDGRGYNPFYGNFVAPISPPWGTAEGIALLASDDDSRAFFRRRGFREEVEACRRIRNLRGVDRFQGAIPEGVVIEEVENWQPILGSDDGTPFPLENESRTWILRTGDIQIGALVAFPMGFNRTHYAIYSFEIELERRGKGLGRLLLEYALAALAHRGASEVEVLALPEESPEADHLYESFEFAAQDRWIVLA